MGTFAAARRYPWVLPLALAAVVVVLPQLGITFNVQRQIELISILVLLTSGLNLSLGYAGELALGQVAMYAAGAYVAGYMSIHGVTDIVLQLLTTAAVAVLVGLVSGIPGLRLGSWSLAMTSFFLVLLIPDIVQALSAQTGGPQGMTGITSPTFFGAAVSTDGFYLIVTIVAAIWLVVLRNLLTSRHGTAFRVLRQSPILASSLGISVYRMKLTAYALGALPAGLAGCFFANLEHYINPVTFGFALAITIVAASVLGGSTSVYGAVVGGIVLQLLTSDVSAFSTYRVVVYGGLLIVFGVLLGSGVAGMTRRLAVRVERRLAAQVASGRGAPVEIEPLHGVELRVEGIGKSFGGIRALDDVSLVAAPGQVTALIGPNGSGKTTLLNVICGYYRLDEGVVRVAGVQRPRHERPHDVARAGISRTFQTANIPEDISVLEVARSGRYTTDRSPMISAILRLRGFLRVRRRDTEEAEKVLRQVGLDQLADREAASLPLGTRRLLELARALVRRPGVLLLDEVASGLDEREVEQLAELIRRVRDAGGTIVLVEHNFGLVLSLADSIYVLAEGSVIASGTPAEIERNPRVLEEYLGVKDPEVLRSLESAWTAEPNE